MKRRDTEIVTAIRRALASRIEPEQFELWFAGGKSVDVDAGRVVVTAVSQFKLDRLMKFFRDDVRAATDETLGSDIAVEFVIDETATNQPQGEPPKANLSESAASKSMAPKDVERKNQPRRFQSFRTFVASESSRLALTACEMAANQPGELNPVYLHGPSGTGKSHLLESIWVESRRIAPRRRVVYLTSEQFTTYFLESLHGSGLPSFRRKYRQVDLFLLDDVQFFAGKAATLTEVQHTIDHLLNEGCQVVLTADRAPEDLPQLGSGLTTRLSAGLKCKLAPPDRETRVGIARQLATRMKLEISREVLEYIADHIAADARQIGGALNRLSAWSRAYGRPINDELASEALADLTAAAKRALRLPDIEQAVCRVLGLEADTLRSQSKAKSVSHPRMLAMWLARKHTRAALSEIGGYFGRRSHATVVSAQKKVNEWVSGDAELQVDGREWTIAGAIRQIEGQLQTG